MENKQATANVTLNVTEVPTVPTVPTVPAIPVPSTPTSPRLFSLFKNVSTKVRNYISPPILVQAALLATVAYAAPSIPDETMNLVYAVGGAAAAAAASSSSRSSSPGSSPILQSAGKRPNKRLGNIFESMSLSRRVGGGGHATAVDLSDESSDDDSVITVDEDSDPSLGERKRVNYNEEQLDDMKDDRDIFEIQIKKMKRSKRYISYENQTSVAASINHQFNDWSVVIQMVIGYTQSGKTGCMVELIDQMTKDTSSTTNPISIENIFIITGLSSRDWMKQTKGRIPECMKDRVFHNGQLAKFKAAVAGKQNVLIIIDEAHMASKKKQTMSRIFKELNWKLDYMMENDIKLVQFSATPDGLIFALNGPKWPEEHYKITTMTPGCGYFGAKQMNERKQLKQIKDIYGRDRDGNWIDDEVREECLANIVEILRDQLSFDEPRYLIVRIRGGISEDSYHKNFFEAIHSLSAEDQEMFEACNIHSHRRYDMRGNVEDISELLYTSPEKHTIVFIKEKMKCAQTLEYVVLDEKTGKTETHKVKHNIGVVVERKRSGTKDEQNDSFTIQGLLGRLCGYEQHDCICYTNLTSFEKYERLFESNFDTETLKRVSWNSNTTLGKGDGRGTSVHPNINDDCVDGDNGSDESRTEKPEHIKDWIRATKDTWESEWSKYCDGLPEERGRNIKTKKVKNPFDEAEPHRIAFASSTTTSSYIWKGSHRGWKVLKFDIDSEKLFKCDADENLTPKTELDCSLGFNKTDSVDKIRRCVCYNSENQLGVLIVSLKPKAM